MLAGYERHHPVGHRRDTDSDTGTKQWLNGAVGYEVYVRSFADSNGDGIGDIAGITGRLDYLKWLGVDIVWVTPFYPSPGHDHGYDVSFYCDVDPQHGSLADVDAMIERAHQLDMKIVFDIVPNHTSSEHRWFKTAIADPTSPERDYYLFRDPKADGSPPNNWISHFRRQRVDARQQTAASTTATCSFQSSQT